MKDATSSRSDIRLWVETAIAGGGIVLAGVTLFWREWIEFLFGFDPDHGNGSVEWLFVLALAVIGVGFGIAARREWRSRTMPAGERA